MILAKGRKKFYTRIVKGLYELLINLQKNVNLLNILFKIVCINLISVVSVFNLDIHILYNVFSFFAKKVNAP